MPWGTLLIPIDELKRLIGTRAGPPEVCLRARAELLRQARVVAFVWLRDDHDEAAGV